MSERFSVEVLEQFRDSRFRAFHWIEDPAMCDEVINYFTQGNKKYGIEVGFGQEPTRVHNIDPNLQWIITEHNTLDFRSAKQLLRMFWEDVDKTSIPKDLAIYALNRNAAMKDVLSASVAVFRNPNFVQDEIPSYSQLREGQRAVFIISGWILDLREDGYKKYFPKYGYQWADFQTRATNITPLRALTPRVDKWNRSDLILDVTKK